jgi:hypothetical protein
MRRPGEWSECLERLATDSRTKYSPFRLPIISQRWCGCCLWCCFAFRQRKDLLRPSVGLCRWPLTSSFRTSQPGWQTQPLQPCSSSAFQTLWTRQVGGRSTFFFFFFFSSFFSFFFFFFFFLVYFNGPDDSVVITGDINAMWLRDSCNQVLPYIQFANVDSTLDR